MALPGGLRSLPGKCIFKTQGKEAETGLEAASRGQWWGIWYDRGLTIIYCKCHILWIKYRHENRQLKTPLGKNVYIYVWLPGYLHPTPPLLTMWTQKNYSKHEPLLRNVNNVWRWQRWRARAEWNRRTVYCTVYVKSNTAICLNLLKIFLIDWN